jgi:hypothetical protein
MVPWRNGLGVFSVKIIVTGEDFCLVPFCKRYVDQDADLSTAANIIVQSHATRLPQSHFPVPVLLPVLPIALVVNMLSTPCLLHPSRPT